MEENLWQKLVDVVSETLAIEPEQVEPEARFIEDLGADSLEVVDLIVAFEEEFGILIPDADLAAIRTVGEAMSYLRQRLLKTA